MQEMLFCPDCGTKLGLDHSGSNLNSTLQYKCPKCGYVKSGLSDIGKHITRKPETAKERIVVFDEKDLEFRTTQTCRAECPKCNNDLAHIWQVQTRSGDEGSTQFYRCTKCGHTWRLYT